jgi:small ligand-binding sensory domain FIST
VFEKIELINDIEQIAKTTHPQKQYLILCAENFPFEQIQEKVNAKWMGAIFPALFDTNGINKSDAYVCTLRSNAKLIWFDDDFSQDCSNLNSYLMIVSGKDPEVGKKLESLFEFTPANSVVFGGGAGTLERPLEDCLFNGSQYKKEGTVLVASTSFYMASAQHGYQSMGDYSIVSSAHGNCIEEIDFKSAFEVYKDAIKRHADLDVTPENLFEIGLKYPLIFERAFGENTVRNPIATDGRTMMMVGSVLEDTVVSLGSITQNELLQASSYCAKALHVNTNNARAIIFDCVGRSKVLGDVFDSEIEGIIKQLNPIQLLGVLSLGEIANTAKYYVEFFNSTCVIGVPNAV